MIDLESIKINFEKEMLTVASEDSLNAIRTKYLGKNGEITNAMKCIKDIPNAEKKAFGESVNAIKTAIEAGVEKAKIALEDKAIADKITNTKMVDLTVPSSLNAGSLHPITIVQEKISKIFKSIIKEVAENDLNIRHIIHRGNG